MSPLLELRRVSVTFPRGRRILRALHRVDLTVASGEIVAVVGESGSGKTTLARLVARLVPPRAGALLLDGRDVLADERHRASRAYRQRVQLVFQDPFASLNPVHTVGRHLARPLRVHRRASRADLEHRVHALLAEVGLEPPTAFAPRHPHQLSGGERQRVAIARALAPGPDLLLADEPTSMLDTSVRTEVLGLLERLRRERGLAVLLITHDLAAAHLVADRMVVMYAGLVVEQGPTASVTTQPAHPYTRLLLAALPRAGGALDEALPGRPGLPPVIDPPPGCPFAERCPRAHPRCTDQLPPLHRIEPSWRARCHLVDPEREPRRPEAHPEAPPRARLEAPSGAQSESSPKDRANRSSTA